MAAAAPCTFCPASHAEAAAFAAAHGLRLRACRLPESCRWTYAVGVVIYDPSQAPPLLALLEVVASLRAG